MLHHEDIPREFNITTYFLDRNLEEGRRESIALRGPAGEYSYGDLAELTNRVGNALRDLGVRQEERVLLALSDSVEFVASWFGAQKIGAVTAEVYSFLQPGDYAYYLDYTRAGVVIVDQATVDKVREAAKNSHYLRTLLVVGGKPEELHSGEESFEELTGRSSPDLEAAPTTRDDIAIWKFTTGSTGRPKACVHPAHSPMLNFDWYARQVVGLGADDVVLPVPKLFFGYARDLAALYPFGVGGSGVVFPDRTTPDIIFELIRRYRPTILVNVPTMMRAMLDHPAAADQDLSCLRLCTSAGETLPEAIYHRWMDTFGVEVLEGIGSSEAYYFYVCNRIGNARPGSVGTVLPGYKAWIVDEDGNELPDGEVGRLWIEGDTAALMYWNDREASKATFAGDRIMSADLFERDQDGYFWYRGRADDLLKVSGVFVAPTQIEEHLIAHPDIVESAVVGIETDGLTLARAYVVVREGSEISADALKEFLRTRLSPQKIPREMEFLRELPKTGSGKIDRAGLREKGS